MASRDRAREATKMAALVSVLDFSLINWVEKGKIHRIYRVH